MKKILIGSIVTIVMFGSCAKSVNSNSYSCDPSYDPCALKAPTSEIEMVKSYLVAHKDSIYHFSDTVQHCSGLYYIIDSVGTGKTADVCSTIAVKYKGMLADSSVFQDQSANAVSFPLGQSIAGFKNAIPKIKEGGGMHLYIPASLAYGNNQVGPIPPNSMLIFQVQLISVQ